MSVIDRFTPFFTLYGRKLFYRVCQKYTGYVACYGLPDYGLFKGVPVARRKFQRPGEQERTNTSSRGLEAQGRHGSLRRTAEGHLYEYFVEIAQYTFDKGCA